MDLAEHRLDSTAVRRRLIKLSLLGGLASVTPAMQSRAQESTVRPAPPSRLPLPSMPIVDARFPAEVAPDVFVIPDKRIPFVPNIGIVIGRKKVLVVDCGLGPASAQNILKAVQKLAPGRQIVLTVTHAHPEHTFGAQVFKPGSHIFYNGAQRDYLLRSGAKLLEGFRGILPPEHKHLLDGVILTPPDKTYDGSVATLDLGGRSVQFRTWGTAHTPGDQIIYLPDERILFGGDLLEDRMFPIVPLFPPMISAEDIDVAQWEVALTDIVRMDPRMIVPGHGNLGGVEMASQTLDYFTKLRALVRAGGSSEMLIERIEAMYPTWENAAFVAPAVQYLSYFQ